MNSLEEPGLGFADIRATIPARSYERSVTWALSLAAGTLALYGGLTWLTYQTDSLILLAVLAVARGLAVGPVFIVAHDACHDSLSPSTRLNYWLGRLCFLPSWHSFTAWKVRHNHLHHRHTNILELDPGYAPASPAQYQAWSPGQRLRYRLSRTLPGAALLYLPEALKGQIFPSRQLREEFGRIDARYTMEWLCVWLWIAVELALFSGLAAAVGAVPPSPQPALALVGAFLLTHLAWNWQMGFTTFLHHFHPDIAWHSEKDAPPAPQRQLECTAHADLGTAMHLPMLNIFVHTAHHVDTRIPLYRLQIAQRALEQQFAPQVARWKFAPATALRCFRECQLWDPAQGQWQSFHHACGKSNFPASLKAADE
ncbi:fatty acid desaturase family protein [Polaromonas sp.]|uniref:fatty acid desaturase family protein n=1 Tax=Polaromonas sp. TaxID=1869339 RepID=UPI003752A9DF